MDVEQGVAEWFAAARQTPAEPADGSIVQSRLHGIEHSNRLARTFTLSAPGDVVIADDLVAGPGGDLEVRIYRPRSVPLAAPTILYLHGGGFVGGSVDEDVNHRILARRAVETGVQIIALEYRLAPEHPYPAAVEDTIAALRAMYQRARRYGVDPRRLGVGGISAGAGIAASAVLRLRDEGGARLIHQSLEVPAVSLHPIGTSARQYAKGYGLDGIPRLAAMYLGDAPIDQYAEPLAADDLSGLPPTLIVVAEFDPLRDAGRQFAQALTTAGVPTTLIEGVGHLHGSSVATAVSAAARDWQDSVAAEIRAAFGTG